MKLRGSYTIEATMLMTILIPLLTGILYLGFYLHDKALMEGAAWETAAFVSLHVSENKEAGPGKEKMKELLEGRLLGIRRQSEDVIVDKESVTVSYCGKMLVPDLILPFFTNSNVDISGSVKLMLQDPVSMIQKVRNVKKLFKKGE